MKFCGVDLFKPKDRLMILKIKLLIYKESNNWQDNLVPVIHLGYSAQKNESDVKRKSGIKLVRC